jgi:hypothetical protein
MRFVTAGLALRASVASRRRSRGSSGDSTHSADDGLSDRDAQWSSVGAGGAGGVGAVSGGAAGVTGRDGPTTGLQVDAARHGSCGLDDCKGSSPDGLAEDHTVDTTGTVVQALVPVASCCPQDSSSLGLGDLAASCESDPSRGDRAARISLGATLVRRAPVEQEEAQQPQPEHGTGSTSRVPVPRPARETEERNSG